MASSFASPRGVSQVENSQSSATRNRLRSASGFTLSRTGRAVSSGEQGSSLLEKPKVSWDCAKARTVMDIGKSHSRAGDGSRTECGAIYSLVRLRSRF